jgi:S-adenosylmethionine-diacylglycerol 3-amino-3-carboxypropyl transferase
VPWYIGTVADRVRLEDSVVDKLFFAQVREDPVLEIEALAPAAGKTYVVVGSGGCTALSLLAAGAGRVVAVDLNRVQNHVTELKAAAVQHPDAVGFLGGAPMADRLGHYRTLAPHLTEEARAYWDAHPKQVERGVLGAGVTEKFIGGVMSVMRTAIHPPSRIRRLLACRTVEEQRALFAEEWDTRRWRLLFTALLNRAVFRKTYHPAFFEHVDNPSFADHFRRLADHTLTEIPIATNYFLHYMLTGAYPAAGLPPYLERTGAGALTIVDGSYTEYLRMLPDGSVHGFAISNILEWFTPDQADQLFTEVVRTAVPGARFVFRNFVGWNEVPERWRDVVVEDRARGEEMITRDRSAVQRRIAVCTVKP